jgi:hypothetical protein
LKAGLLDAEMSEPTGDDEGVVISGYVAYYEPLRPAADYMRDAETHESSAAIASGREKERLLRAAAEHYVNAFLVDRVGHRAAFGKAHRLGRQILREFGCPYTLREDGQAWVLKCGVRALHSRLGLSPGGPTLGQCSICGAADFGCDHLNGEVYNGQRCFRLITRWDVREVSLVTKPYDPRCYRLDDVVSVRAAERARGRPLLPNEAPACEHCATCRGIPSNDDLSPEEWEMALSTADTTAD